MTKKNWKEYIIENTLIIGTIVLFIIGYFSSDYFFTVRNIQNLLISISIIGILSIGAMYVMLFGEIDLSMGYLMIFSYFFSIKLQQWVGGLVGMKALTQGTIFSGSQLLLGTLGIAIACAVGFINGFGVVYGKVKSFIMTLGMMGILHGANFVLSKGKSFFLSRAESYLLLGEINILKIFPLMSIVTFLLVGISVVLLKFNIVGKRIYAVGANRKAASLAGINIDAWIISAFVISGFCAGLAGLFFSARNTIIDPKQSGTAFAITAIAIAALGGTTLEGGEGSPWKVLSAGLFLGTLLNILLMKGISGWFQSIIVGFIIIVGFVMNRISKRTKRVLY
jgi:ribose transport system permease protein